MADRQDTDALVSEFLAMCDTTHEQALQYLQANEWNVSAACSSFYQDEEERTTSDRDRNQPTTETADDNYTGPRTLDGRPAPEASGSAPRRAVAQPKKKGVATLGSLGGGGHNHDNDDDDDDYDEDEDDHRGDLFAGGEKSGLAVKDPKNNGGPKKIISDILAKAKANATRQDATPDAGPSQPSFFRGTGMTLGGEGQESRSIPDPDGAARQTTGPPQERVLHIWRDGFSVDDGELRRFDDPANQMDLQMIRSGRAPLHLMNVENDQPVDVKLHQHDTPYTPQPKKYKPFAGSGQRLGSVVPGDGNTASAPSSTATTQAAPTTQAPSSGAAPQVDDSQPTIMIRIQLPDGTRLPARFNTSHTLSDVYGFVQGASPDTRTREWVLATTFPNKEHTDQDLVLSEIPEFKKGGTAVVKWK